MSPILLLLLLAGGAAAEPADINSLAWLSGCWASEHGETGSGEQWSRPAGGSMLGMSRFVRNGNTVAWEFLRITETDDGSLLLIAAPSGQESHAFPLASVAEHEVVFEDPQHDFPQRILYRLVAPDQLLGRIEGELNGQSRSVDFPMTRSACSE